MIKKFASIYEQAAKRKGGENALNKLLPQPKSKKAIKAISADRWLAEMTRAIFQAGFNWKVVDSMWPGFEAAFEGFNPERWHFMTDEDLDRLVSDTRIVRYGAKIKSVQGNSSFLLSVMDEHESVGNYFANWPANDFVGLLADLKKRGDRLGGQTAQYFLRSMGVDGFILSKDGVAAMIDAGVVDKQPTSKKDMAAVQEAYNRWMDESGLSLMAISRVLGLSTGNNQQMDD